MKIISVVSARPNFVKLAALHHALRSGAGQALEHVIVHTGQHYDPLFSDIFFEQLEIPKPSYNLGIHADEREITITSTEEALFSLLSQLKPDCVLVYGDVNGSLGGARAAKRAGVQLAHVEAGLRSFDQSMPEELNRIAVDQVADFLFCTEESAIENLKREKVDGSAHLVGNTMIDTLVRMMPFIEEQKLSHLLPNRFGVVTLHRPSNVDEPTILKRNIDFLVEVAPRCQLLLPCHHRLRSSLERFGLARFDDAGNCMNFLNKGLHICAPFGYVQFLHLIKKSAFIITDSGGIQEEAVFLQKRCFTLRKNTERPITIESGSNVLIDIADPEDRKEVLAFASESQTPAIEIPRLWDGRAGERILETLQDTL